MNTMAVGSNEIMARDVVARLRTTFMSGKTRDLAWRQAQLQAMVRLHDECREQIVAAVQADLRREKLEAAMLEIPATRSEAVAAAKHVAKWAKPERVRTGIAAMPGKSWVQYEPLGVVLVIAPWNYPIHLALAPMVAALAAGNCIILKPSEVTPHCSALLAKILPMYLDSDAIAVVEGGPDITQALIDQKLDHCFFTGSTVVGKAIMKAAAEYLTPVTLELGGKCPAVVTASADLGVAARRIAWGKLTNSGQTCVAPDYVLVDRQVRDAFIAELTSTLITFSEGKRKPIINSRHAARIATLLRDCGGTIALGGQVDVERAEAEPTVVVDPSPDSMLLRDEIFGPVLPIITVDSLDDAIAHVQQGDRPLASYLFTEDNQDKQRFIANVVTGGIVVNHVLLHLSVPDLPFGGVGSSGMGRYHGRWGFQAFSNAKAVLSKPARPDISLIYPPYTGWKKKLLERA